MATAKPVAKAFTATLERGGGRLMWTIVRIPFDVAKLWGKRGHVHVFGTVNGFDFRTSLFPGGDGRHAMLVNKKMQKGARIAPGSTARFQIQPDLAERPIKMPPELTRALRQSKPLARYFAALSGSMRRYFVNRVAQAKHAETRVRRAEETAELFMAAMEAERGELPPVLQIELARNPKARAGWERMPPTHRRHNLLGIFGYRSPEARARRVAKAVQEMVAYAEGRSGGRRARAQEEESWPRISTDSRG